MTKIILAFVVALAVPASVVAQFGQGTVSVVPAPTVSLSATPSSVPKGSSSTLAWSSTNASSCTASGGWNGTKATSGSQSSGAISATKTFTLSCTGIGGTARRSVVVTVVPAPTLTGSASPKSVVNGGSSTLMWSTKNATSCTASGAWTGMKAINGSASTGALTANSNFSMTCTGVGGSVTGNLLVTVIAAPTVSFSSTPASVVSGNVATLSWSSANATSCSASGGWSGTKATSGQQLTAHLTADTTFVLVCSGAGGSTSAATTVAVSAVPSVLFSATPSAVASGGTSTLSWTSANTTTCLAGDGWSGGKAASGSESTDALTSSTTYALTCSGPSGSASASVLVTVGAAASNAIFPLHTEAGKRFLVDARGQPFLVHGDTAWALIVEMTDPEADQYLDDRQAKGFNTILVGLLSRPNPDSTTVGLASTPPNNVYGVSPFLTAADFSTPNEAYFAHAAKVIQKAADRNMLVLLAPAYMGYMGGSEGWYQQMSANGTTKLRAYGQYLANRFSDFSNIVWVNGGDYSPPETALLAAVANGIRDVDTRWLQTFHGGRGTAALQFLGSSTGWLTLNSIYTDEYTVVERAFAEYARSQMPFFLIEASYEGAGATAKTARTQAYQAVLSGGAGQMMGNLPIWIFGSGWQQALNSPASRTMPHLRSLLEATAWWTLQPDTSGVFLTGAVGSGLSRAVSGYAADGSFSLTYTPDLRDLTFNFSRLAGPKIRVRWYDPTNGTYTLISDSPFTTASSQTFRPPGANSAGDSDWVLVLESQP